MPNSTLVPRTRRFVILAAVDGLPLDAEVARYAARIARDIPACELHFCHACAGVDPSFGWSEVPKDATEALALEKGRQLLLSAMTEARQAYLSTLASHVLASGPARQVLQLAQDINADLIVCGTRNLQGITRFVLGSVSDAITKQAHCPVLVVRPKHYVERPPEIEPACEACLATQERTHGRDLWCERHHHRRRHMHVYSEVHPVGFGEGSMFLK